MIPMTPRGTRILPSLIPLGRSVSSVVSPIGSASLATCCSPSIIPSMRASLSSKRSTNAGSRPFSRPFFKSRKFAAKTCWRLLFSSSAMASRAAFFTLVLVAAITREAERACCPSFCIYSLIFMKLSTLKLPEPPIITP